MVEADFKMPGGMRDAADALRAGGLRAHRFMHAPARGTVTAMGASSARKMSAGGGSLGASARWRRAVVRRPGAPGGYRTSMSTDGTLFACMAMTGARSPPTPHTHMPGTAKAPGRAPVQMMQPRSGLVFKTRTLPGKNPKNCPISGDFIY